MDNGRLLCSNERCILCRSSGVVGIIKVILEVLHEHAFENLLICITRRSIGGRVVATLGQNSVLGQILDGGIEGDFCFVKEGGIVVDLSEEREARGDDTLIIGPSGLSVVCAGIRIGGSQSIVP